MMTKDEFISTIKDTDEIEVEKEQEEPLNKKRKNTEFNKKFSFQFEDFSTTQQPWDFTEAKKQLRTDIANATSINEKIRRRLQLRQEAKDEERPPKKKRTEPSNDEFDAQDDDDIVDGEQEREQDEQEEEEEEETANQELEEADEQEEEEEEEEEETKEESDDDMDEVEHDTELKDMKSRKKQSTPTKEDFFSTEPTSMVTSWSDMDLAKPLMKAINTLGYKSPTPIQSQTIPVAMLGKDICGSAETGSGKTAAFVLPILHKLLHTDRKTPAIRCLILAPTRELATQCQSVLEKLAQYTSIRSCLVVGGLSNLPQEASLRTSPDIVVATPGRLIDHILNTNVVDLSSVEYLIIDEADRMLEVGFMEAVEQIVQYCPKSRQSLLFSATMTEEIDRLIKLSLNKPVRVKVDNTHAVAKNVAQEFIKVKSAMEEHRAGILLALCKRTVKSKAIIFFQEKHEAHRLKIIFGLAGLNAAELHGNLSQQARLEALESFRDGNVDYLLATDLAARGLDILGIETVINYTMPRALTAYIHRVGRTARAGKLGKAISLASEADRKLLKKIIKSAKVKERVIPKEAIITWSNKIKELNEDINAIEEEEKLEKIIRKEEHKANKLKKMLELDPDQYEQTKKKWYLTAGEKSKLADLRNKDVKDLATKELDDETQENRNKKNKKKEEKKKEKTRKQKRREKLDAEGTAGTRAAIKATKRQQNLVRLGLAAKKIAKRPKKKASRPHNPSSSKFANDTVAPKIGKKKSGFHSKKRYKRQ